MSEKNKIKFKKGHVKPTFGNILCIILKEGKGSKWVWINENTDNNRRRNNR